MEEIKYFNGRETEAKAKEKKSDVLSEQKWYISE